MAKSSPAHSHVIDPQRLRDENDDDDSEETKAQSRIVAVSLLQPRVAVALGIPRQWHRLLSLCRLLSILPSLWWGLRYALRFLIAEYLRPDHARDPSRLIETALAIVWCAASAYLAFFFTDCLMSRWLINYTPQATVVRLVAISCLFAYIASWVVFLTAAAERPSLLLPAWIGIATMLTACYHFTQRKIKIRKETFASMSVFSLASYISMVALLFQLHLSRTEFHHAPLAALVKRAGEFAVRLAVNILELNTDDIRRGN